MTKEKNGPVTAIVFDFETGGLDNKKCGATQLAAHAVGFRYYVGEALCGGQADH